MKLPNVIFPGEVLHYARKYMEPDEIDHHGNGHGMDDLYLKVTPVSREIVNRLSTKVLVGVFTDQIEGKLWYDLPFCFTATN